MRITFQRTGGFAAPAMRRSLAVDTEDLPADEARDLAKLVQSADLTGLPQTAASPGRGRDRFSYRLTVEDGGRTQIVETSESDMPEQLRPLVHWLTNKSAHTG